MRPPADVRECRFRSPGPQSTHVGLILLTVIVAFPVGACSGVRATDKEKIEVQNTEAADSAAFLEQLSLCRSESGAFDRLLTGLAQESPLPVEALRGRGTFFGQGFQDRGYSPLFIVDLSDLERLPELDAVKGWAPDSNWAWTRCEVLGHELAEAIRYRQLWAGTTEADRGGAVDTGFTARLRDAHAFGLTVEAGIAKAQGTRRDAAGRPYGRRTFCQFEGVVNIIFGPSTETLVLDADGNIASITYHRDSNLCDDPAWQDSAVAIQRRRRGEAPVPPK